MTGQQIYWAIVTPVFLIAYGWLIWYAFRIGRRR